MPGRRRQRPAGSGAAARPLRVERQHEGAQQVRELLAAAGRQRGEDALLLAQQVGEGGVDGAAAGVFAFSWTLLSAQFGSAWS